MLCNLEGLRNPGHPYPDSSSYWRADIQGTVQWQQTSDGKKRVRVNPELIEIENATQIWSKPYEANFSSVFELQADIAATVAGALNLTLIKSEKQNLQDKITDNSEAYDLYLRALVYGEDMILIFLLL